MNADQLLEHFHRIGDAPDAMPRLRRFILDLAVRGKLVPQDRNDEPASELLKRIAAEKVRLVKAGEIRKDKPLPPISEDALLFELPSGWAWERLGNIGETNIGLTYSPQDISEVGIPVLRSSNIQNGKLDFSDLVRVKDEPKQSVMVQQSDLLICARNGSRALVGKVAVIEDLKEPAAFGAFMAIFRSEVNQYLYHFICSPLFRHVIAEVNTTTINQITQNNLRSTLAPLPPLAEQQRIVAKVDELMALCDRLEAARDEREMTRDRLSAASLARLDAPDPDSAILADHARFALDNLGALTTRPDQIKQLRQTILNLAVRGKLVPQDPKDEPASELLKRIEKEKARLISEKKLKRQKDLLPIEVQNVPFDVLNGWAWAKADDVFLNITDGFHNTPSPVLEGRPYVTAKHIRPNKIDFENCLYVDEKNHRELFAKTRVKRGDILIVNIGAGCGTPAMVNVDFEFSFKNVAIVNLPSEMDGNFILLFLLYYRDLVFDDLIKGGAQPFLGLGMLREMLIPLPPLAEQHRIVATVDELMALCDRLESSLAIGDQTRRCLLDALIAGALAPGEMQQQAA
jgi:type I restriction enzyme, S subunit